MSISTTAVPGRCGGESVARKGLTAEPALSPDGTYVAYQSNESGRYEVYVRPFPSGAGQWQVSVGGGGEARWSPKGDKLWFGPSATC